jgi:hypothetical protein
MFLPLTQHSLIDPWLNHLDNFFGLNSIKLLTYIVNKNYIVALRFLNVIYLSMEYVAITCLIILSTKDPEALLKLLLYRLFYYFLFIIFSLPTGQPVSFIIIQVR